MPVSGCHRFSDDTIMDTRFSAASDASQNMNQLLYCEISNMIWKVLYNFTSLMSVYKVRFAFVMIMDKTATVTDS